MTAKYLRNWRILTFSCLVWLSWKERTRNKEIASLEYMYIYMAFLYVCVHILFQKMRLRGYATRGHFCSDVNQTTAKPGPRTHAIGIPIPFVMIQEQTLPTRHVYVKIDTGSVLHMEYLNKSPQITVKKHVAQYHLKGMTCVVKLEINQ